MVGYIAYILSFLLNTWLSTMTEGWFQDSVFNSGALFNVTMFIAGGVICLWLFRAISRGRISRSEFGLHTHGLRSVVLIGGALGLLFFGFSEVMEANSRELSEASEVVMNNFNIGNNFINDMLLLLSIGLFAPVVEEMLFRGAIFNPIFQSLKAKKVMPSWIALVVSLTVSTLLFAYTHGGEGQEEQLWLLGVLGVFAGLAMYFSKSLLGAIVVHAVNNNLVFMYMIYKQDGLGATYSIALILASVCCLILCIPLGLLFGKILPRLPK